MSSELALAHRIVIIDLQHHRACSTAKAAEEAGSTSMSDHLIVNIELDGYGTRQAEALDDHFGTVSAKRLP